MVSEVKYLCAGGHVVSRYDRELHYVPSRNLPSLYRVNPEECKFTDEQHPMHGTTLAR